LAVELLEVPAQLIQTALDLELAERTVVADAVGETACIFLAGLYRAEQAIAERLLCLVNGKLPWPYIDPEKALPWIEQKTGLSLGESQIAAIRLALSAATMRLPTPGCGSLSRSRCCSAGRRHDGRTGNGGVGDSTRSPLSVPPRSTEISEKPRISTNSSTKSQQMMIDASCHNWFSLRRAGG
jgi:hypothetical protein